MLVPGETVGQYVVEEKIGQGGMASVYRVRHTGLDSDHALKVLDLPYAAVRERLMLEGRVQAQLSHPNIVAVTDLVEVNGAPGLIMEYVSGSSLDGWLADNRPDPGTLTSLYSAILDGVGHAHRHGLVHRDLKPGNILLHSVDDRIVPKITDFGIAKFRGDDAAPSLTQTGFAMGTPGYMAPEQIRNAKDVDARADIFALGCILYELWCGAPPFRGDSVYDVLTAIEAGDYPPPTTVRADLPSGIGHTIACCLAPEPEDRLASVEALRAAMFGDASTVLVMDPPPELPPELMPDPSRRRAHPTLAPPEPHTAPPLPPPAITTSEPVTPAPVRVVGAAHESSRRRVSPMLALAVILGVLILWIGIMVVGMGGLALVDFGLLDTGF